MKAVIVAALFAVFLSAPAFAYDVHLGTISCRSGQVGKCSSFPAMENWALIEMSRELNCQPNQGSCSAVKNREYRIEIEVKDIETCGITHYRVEAEPFNAPVPMGHILIWKNVDLSGWTCNHTHKCRSNGQEN